MISVKNLKKNFGSLCAVNDISFEVADGELFGFLGPNGAGKTTTLSMISGLLKPDAGTVYVEDINVWESPKAAKRILGLVPQDVSLYEEFSAKENLNFWGSLYGVPRSTLKQNIQEILARVGLSDRANEPVSKYSGGMKRRLNLAIGLVHNPKVVLLDEPTVGIDPQARHNIMEIIREIARQGTTILFTTHHLDEAETLCERIAIMDHGKILQVGTVDELARETGDGEIITVRGEFTPTQFQAAIQGAPVQVLSVSDHAATLTLRNESYGIAQLVHQLAEAGITIADLSLQKPSLESVFLKLTGRELRD